MSNNIPKASEDLLREVASKYAHMKTTPNARSTISDEQIKKAFAIVDSHTKFLDNLTVLNNLNMTVNVISTLLMLDIKDKETTEDGCKEIIEGYITTFTEDSKDESTNELQEVIKSYITNSCMIYYVVSKKDREKLLEYNKKVNDSILKILQLISKPNIPTNKKPNIETKMEESK